MSGKTFFKKFESIKENARVNTLVEKLRSKLKDFKVTDRQGELVGEVKDLIVDTNHQINLVVSKIATNQSSHLFLLISKLIQRIDSSNKSVTVDIDGIELDDWSEYIDLEETEMESDISNNFEADEVTPQNSADASAFRLPMPSEPKNNQEEVDSEAPREDIIRLLGERLIVERTKRKAGEVIVRKQIETRMVQVPVRHEKLIVEQVSPERKQLAEFDLGQGEITGIQLNKPASIDDDLMVVGEFSSPKIASLVLNAIAMERRHDCKKIRVQIVVEDAERQRTYQEWFDRCSGNQTRQSES